MCCILFFLSILPPPISLLFFFNDTATTEIYTLSLHDALPISGLREPQRRGDQQDRGAGEEALRRGPDPLGEHHVLQAHRRVEEDRKSTRLNSSHQIISYAVFCLKKKKKHITSNSKSINMVISS